MAWHSDVLWTLGEEPPDPPEEGRLLRCDQCGRTWRNMARPSIAVSAICPECSEARWAAHRAEMERERNEHCARLADERAAEFAARQRAIADVEHWLDSLALAEIEAAAAGGHQAARSRLWWLRDQVDGLAERLRAAGPIRRGKLIARAREAATTRAHRELVELAIAEAE